MIHLTNDERLMCNRCFRPSEIAPIVASLIVIEKNPLTGEQTKKWYNICSQDLNILNLWLKYKVNMKNLRKRDGDMNTELDSFKDILPELPNTTKKEFPDIRTDVLRKTLNGEYIE